MINVIRSLFNINKKLYIILNDEIISKGKAARVCFTIGQKTPNYRFSSVIVVKGGDRYYSTKNGLINTRFFLGEHLDAGRTQVEKGTSLGFCVWVHKDTKLDYKLY